MGVTLLLSAGLSHSAFAQSTQSAPSAVPPASDEATAPPGTVLAPKDALELQFHLGYTQPFGKLSRDVNVSDVAHAGFGSGGALAWRISPRFGVAGYGAFHHSSPDQSLGGGLVFGMAGGVRGDFHFLPYRRVDPFVSLGSGYRLMFVAPGGPADNHMLHGFEALTANAGADFRISKDFALGPMLGADVNVFVWDLDSTTGTNTTIANKSVGTFFFAGVAGKLDVLGKRVPEHAASTPAPTPAAGPPESRPVKAPPAP